MTTPPITSLRKAAMAATPDYSDIEDRTGQNLIPAPSLGQRLSSTLFDARNSLAQYNFIPSSMLAEAKRQYQAGQQPSIPTPQQQQQIKRIAAIQPQSLIK